MINVEVRRTNQKVRAENLMNIESMERIKDQSESGLIIFRNRIQLEVKGRSKRHAPERFGARIFLG